MLADIGGFSVSTAACIKSSANKALGITVYYMQTQRTSTRTSSSRRRRTTS